MNAVKFEQMEPDAAVREVLGAGRVGQGEEAEAATTSREYSSRNHEPQPRAATTSRLTVFIHSVGVATHGQTNGRREIYEAYPDSRMSGTPVMRATTPGAPE